MPLTLTRKLILAGTTAGLLLGVLTLSTLYAARAARTVSSPPTTSDQLYAADAARQAGVVVRLTWIAAILLAGAGFFLFRSEAHAIASGGNALLQQKHDEELRALSLIDDLTQLNNRRGFLALAQQQIKLARRNKRELVLLFVDMDDFKQINDKFGHQQGDVALQRAGRVLRATFRDSDIIARLGGDEFVVLAADTGTSAQIVERLRHELALRNDKDGFPYTLSFSVGAARFDPEDPPTIEELLHMADSMLYEQKRQRRHPQPIVD
jgi:diguanylate cyclase (GGDEF)-like protein